MNQPDNNPKTRAGGMNKLPLHLIPPRALAHVALAFADGGFKYQPYNWHEEQITASVYYGAAMRHLAAWWAGEDLPNDGVAHHLAHAACCLLMVLDTMDTGMLKDNRPPVIGEEFGELLEKLAAKLPELRERESTKFDLHDIADDELSEEESERIAEEHLRLTRPLLRISIDEATPDEWTEASNRWFARKEAEDSLEKLLVSGVITPAEYQRRMEELSAAASQRL